MPTLVIKEYILYDLDPFKLLGLFYWPRKDHASNIPCQALKKNVYFVAG